LNAVNRDTTAPTRRANARVGPVPAVEAHRSVSSGPRVRSSGALATHRVAEAALRSAEERRAVDIDEVE